MPQTPSIVHRLVGSQQGERKNQIWGRKSGRTKPSCRTRSGEINHPPPAEGGYLVCDGSSFWALWSTSLWGFIAVQRGSRAWLCLLGWIWVGFACFNMATFPSVPPHPLISQMRENSKTPDLGTAALRSTGWGSLCCHRAWLQQFPVLLLALGKWRRFSWKSLLTGADRNLERWLVSLFA